MMPIYPRRAVRYTYARAEEYLARAGAQPGKWFMRVYRLLDGERGTGAWGVE